MGNCVSSSVCSRGRRTPSQTQQQNTNPTVINSDETSDVNTNLSNRQQQQQQQQQPNSPSFSNITSTSAGLSSFTSNELSNTFSLNISTSYPYYVPPTGKNKRLKKDYHKYFKFDKKITENQLKAKREEFWDTAPVFEGKAEIWNALKAAVDACEAKNFQLAQAIIDSANIILPNGLLNDCYDELGNRYQIPIYVLAKPINLIKSNDDKESSACLDDESLTSKQKSRNKKKKKKSKIIGDDEDDEDDNTEEIKLSFRKRFFSRKFKSSTNEKIKLSKLSNKKQCSILNEDLNKPCITVEESFQIKIRVSTLNNDSDLKLNVKPSQTIANLKQQVKELTEIEPSCQRMFFGGKLMRDKDRVKAYKLKKNIVVQVIVRQQTNQTKFPLNKINDIENVNDKDANLIEITETQIAS